MLNDHTAVNLLVSVMHRAADHPEETGYWKEELHRAAPDLDELSEAEWLKLFRDYIEPVL